MKVFFCILKWWEIVYDDKKRSNYIPVQIAYKNVHRFLIFNQDKALDSVLGVHWYTAL